MGALAGLLGSRGPRGQRLGPALRPADGRPVPSQRRALDEGLRRRARDAGPRARGRGQRLPSDNVEATARGRARPRRARRCRPRSRSSSWAARATSSSPAPTARPRPRAARPPAVRARPRSVVPRRRRARGVRRRASARHGPEFVLEGDEYDSRVLREVPEDVALPARVGDRTSIEHDHIDIYPTADIYAAAFRRFVELVPADGVLALVHRAAGARAPRPHRRARRHLRSSGRRLPATAPPGRFLASVRGGRPMGSSFWCRAVTTSRTRSPRSSSATNRSVFPSTPCGPRSPPSAACGAARSTSASTEACPSTTTSPTIPPRWTRRSKRSPARIPARPSGRSSSPAARPPVAACTSTRTRRLRPREPRAPRARGPTRSSRGEQLDVARLIADLRDVASARRVRSDRRRWSSGSPRAPPGRRRRDALERHLRWCPAPAAETLDAVR